MSFSIQSMVEFNINCTILLFNCFSPQVAVSWSSCELTCSTCEFTCTDVQHTAYIYWELQVIGQLWYTYGIKHWFHSLRTIIQLFNTHQFSEFLSIHSLLPQSYCLRTPINNKGGKVFPCQTIEICERNTKIPRTQVSLRAAKMI